MLTQQKIEQMFKEMGLASEMERARFIELAELGPEPDTSKEQIFIHITTDTNIEKKMEDVELA